jgi:hypothetical protein
VCFTCAYLTLVDLQEKRRVRALHICPNPPIVEPTFEVRSRTRVVRASVIRASRDQVFDKELSEVERDAIGDMARELLKVSGVCVGTRM